MFSKFDELYQEARAENWCMPNGKPVTIGWIWGYLQGFPRYKHTFFTFEPGTLAYIHWQLGFQASSEYYDSQNH